MMIYQWLTFVTLLSSLLLKNIAISNTFIAGLLATLALATIVIGIRFRKETNKWLFFPSIILVIIIFMITLEILYINNLKFEASLTTFEGSFATPTTFTA